MATLLKIQSSLFRSEGQSAILVNHFADLWLSQYPEDRIVTRDLDADPVPRLDLERFQALVTPAADRTEAQKRVVAYSDRLIEELRRADEIVMGIPMYNFTIPAVLHNYFDHIARSGVTFRYTENGPEGLLTGKKGYAIVTRGGFYGEDHSQTRLARQFLAFIGINDVEFVHAEGLAVSDSSKSASLEEARNRITGLLEDRSTTSPSLQKPKRRSAQATARE